MSEPLPRVLDGITVLDVATWVAAPAAATVMGDFGARVIKVEPPGAGDPYRGLARRPGMPASDTDYCWLLDARNKESIALDLKVAEGHRVLLDLAARADVLLTNLQPGSLGRLGLRWEDLSPLNPRLVYASLTGYGEVGEEADRPGFDANAWWARSGLMDLVRALGAPPAFCMPGMGDHPTALALFGAVMLALYQRERTGRGTKVTSSLTANGLWANGVLVQAMLCGATFFERRPREQARNALANLYQCRDGRWFTLTLLSEGREWEPFARAIERPDLLADPRFATVAARHANSAALVAALDETFAARDWADWRERLGACDLTFGPVSRLADVPGDPQVGAAGLLVPVEGLPGARTVTSPITLGGEPKAPARRPPAVGEHTDAILRELGYDTAAIGRLRALGAVG